MTDLELIHVLQQKSAGELSPAEVEEIRARWTQSPELRQALVEHLHLESQLTGALGPVQLDVDQILKRASLQRRTERVALRSWPWLFGLLMTVCGTGLFVYWNSLRVPDQVVAVQDSKLLSSDPTSVSFLELPADAMRPANLADRSADLAVNDAVGDPPEKVHSPTPPAAEPLPKPVTVEVAANEPWSVGLAMDAAPWSAESPKLTADFKTAGHDELPESESKRWLTSVEGQPFTLSTDSIGNPTRRMSKFQGLAKLRAPWPDDAVLRMTPFDVTDLTLYFWRGPTGVAIRFYTRREPHLWVAFEISRESSSPKPTRFGLLTTDSGAYSRSTPGTLDIRQQGNDLVLARGGLILLSAPMIGPPVEVFIEGQFRLRGLSMHRSVPFTDRPLDAHATLFDAAAAQLPWALSVENPASFLANEDGSLSMTVDSRDKTGLIAFPFGWILATEQSAQASGLFEVIVNVESADPGTGLFLGDRDGRPLQQLGFFKDAVSQQTTFGILRPGEVRVESTYNPAEIPPPYLARSGWFKLIAGLGTLHVLTSGDGVHWGQTIESPGRDLPGAVASMGLFGLPGNSARTIRIRKVQVRELCGILDLADARLRSQVPSFRMEDWKDLAAWNHRVVDTQPQELDADAWFMASAVAAISQGPPKEIGLQLLRQLVKAGMKSSRSFDEKRQMLDDACLVLDLFDEASAKIIGGQYEELGWQLVDSDEKRPLFKLRSAWLWSPIWTQAKLRFVWERLHTHEILQSVYRRDWAASWGSAKSSAYWNLLPHPDQRPADRGEELDRHARWAKALVVESAPQMDDGTGGVLPLSWRHPLVPILNKEAYNVRAELQSALSGQNFEDACRIVMSIAENDGPGLLPDLDDRQLYVSMATAIESARKTYPGFAQTMADKFEPLGQIRVQSAINRRDLSALQTATLQFMGTDAARIAHRSLGELALSVGQFDVAEQHFRDALLDAGFRWKEMLEPRLLLARALGGRLSQTEFAGMSTQSHAQPLDLNGTSISSSEFQAILSDLVARPTSTSALVGVARTDAPPFPPAFYKLDPRAQFDGHPGNNPGRAEYRFGDPFGRQLAAVADDQRIYVSNRFQINAYSSGDGKQIWADGLGSEQGDTYALPFTPMRPLISEGRIFVRRLTKAGAELAGLKSDDGRILWHHRPSHSVLTEPVIWNGRLFAVTLARIDDEHLQVEATWYDPVAGTINSSRPLFRFREATDRQFSGQLTVDDRIAVCTVGGTTASFNSRGEMRWLRRHTFLQKPVDELAEDVRVSVPVIRSGKVIVALPGVRQISCLDLSSGSVVWETPVFNLKGIVAVTDSRIVIETLTGLVALNNETGAIAWQRKIETRLEAVTLSGQSVVVARRCTIANNRSRPVLLWLDVETGAEQSQALVDVAEREEVQMGPLFSAGGKWWSFLGQTWKDPKRELCELIPVPTAVPPKSFANETQVAWTPDVSDAQLAEIQTVVPGWFPVANYRERLVLQPGDLRGEVSTLVSHLDPQNPVRLTTRLHRNPGRKTTLKLRVGNQPGQKWMLTVRTGTQVLLEQVIEDASGTNGWRDVVIELSKFVDRDIDLQLIQSSPANAVDAVLKRAEFLVE